MALQIQLPKSWSDWTLTEVIGEGSFGVVYKAERRSGTNVFYSAIKIIEVPQQGEVQHLLREMRDESSVRLYYRNIVEDYLREIRAMDSLKGITNIVSIEDYAVEEYQDRIGWRIYIRMELLTSFADYYAQNGIGEDEVIKLGTDICTALEYCGEKKIIHRDIKPDNIFVSPYGDFKLGDFGVARQLDVSMGSYTTKGTYLYMAPEVYRGDHYGVTADIYSLGLLMYKLLNKNRDPFVDTEKQIVFYKEKEAALSRRMDGEPLPAPMDASDELAKVILRAVAYQPGDRYQSSTEFKQALLAAKRKEELKPERDRQFLAGMIALAAAALIIAAGTFFWFMNHNKRNQPESNNVGIVQTETKAETERETAAATDPVTETERETAPATNPVTETERETAAVTEPPTETERETAAVTEPPTETEQETAAVTEPPTETEQETAAVMEPVTETEQETVAVTEPPTETERETAAVTEPPTETEQETIAVTEAVTETEQETVAVTEEVTEKGTETEKSTETKTKTQYIELDTVDSSLYKWDMDSVLDQFATGPIPESMVLAYTPEMKELHLATERLPNAFRKKTMEDYFSIDGNSGEPYRRLTFYEYDDQGNLIYESSFRLLNKNARSTFTKNDPDVATIVKYAYDDYGNRTLRAEYEYRIGVDEKWDLQQYITSTYDERENLLEEQVRYTGRYQLSSGREYAQYTLDEQGFRTALLERVKSEGETYERTYDLECDENGRVIRQVCTSDEQDADNVGQVTSYVLDQEGNVLEKTEYAKDGTQISRIEYEIDPYGDTVRVNEFGREGQLLYHAGLTRNEENYITREDMIWYDEEGNETQRSQEYYGYDEENRNLYRIRYHGSEDPQFNQVYFYSFDAGKVTEDEGITIYPVFYPAEGSETGSEANQEKQPVTEAETETNQEEQSETETEASQEKQSETETETSQENQPVTEIESETETETEPQQSNEEKLTFIQEDPSSEFYDFAVSLSGSFWDDEDVIVSSDFYTMTKWDTLSERLEDYTVYRSWDDHYVYGKLMYNLYMHGIETPIPIMKSFVLRGDEYRPDTNPEEYAASTPAALRTLSGTELSEMYDRAVEKSSALDGRIAAIFASLAEDYEPDQIITVVPETTSYSQGSRSSVDIRTIMELVTVIDDEWSFVPSGFIPTNSFIPYDETYELILFDELEQTSITEKEAASAETLSSSGLYTYMTEGETRFYRVDSSQEGFENVTGFSMRNAEKRQVKAEWIRTREEVYLKLTAKEAVSEKSSNPFSDDAYSVEAYSGTDIGKSEAENGISLKSIAPEGTKEDRWSADMYVYVLDEDTAEQIKGRETADAHSAQIVWDDIQTYLGASSLLSDAEGNKMITGGSNDAIWVVIQSNCEQLQLIYDCTKVNAGWDEMWRTTSEGNKAYLGESVFFPEGEDGVYSYDEIFDASGKQRLFSLRVTPLKNYNSSTKVLIADMEGNILETVRVGSRPSLSIITHLKDNNCKMDLAKGSVFKTELLSSYTVDEMEIICDNEQIAVVPQISERNEESGVRSFIYDLYLVCLSDEPQTAHIEIWDKERVPVTVMNEAVHDTLTIEFTKSEPDPAVSETANMPVETAASSASSETVTNPAETTASTAASETDQTLSIGTRMVVTAESLNVRNAPQTGDVVMTLPKGTEVVLAGEIKEGWAQIEYNGQIAFASAKYLEEK